MIRGHQIGQTMPASSRGSINGLWAYRFALHNLVLKDFRIRYRNMSLGILWSILNPLVMLGVLVFIFSYVYPNRTVDHFPIFILIGLIGYNFFSMCVSSTTSCIIDNAPLVKKTIFPRIILPLSVVLSQVIHFVIQLGLLALFILIFRVPVTWSYLWLPVIFVVELTFVAGLCLVCATLTVYYRDVLYLVQSAMTILFWFTPIFYSLTTVHQNLPPSLYGAYILNPLAACIDGARKAILSDCAPDTVAFSVAASVAVFFLGLGVWLFERMQKNFADRL